MSTIEYIAVGKLGRAQVCPKQSAPSHGGRGTAAPLSNTWREFSPKQHINRFLCFDISLILVKTTNDTRKC